MDDLSPVVIEGLALEALGLLTRLHRCGAQERGVPQWLLHAREMVHDQFRQPLGLSAVARAAGVHPVQLARTFRRVHGCTVGEYIRRLRVECAERLLIGSSRSLAEIALAAGFHDQSHLSRAFRSALGVPPEPRTGQHAGARSRLAR